MQLWKTVWQFLERYINLAIPLLGIYPIELKKKTIHTKTYTGMFITAYSEEPKTGNNPNG